MSDPTEASDKTLTREVLEAANNEPFRPAETIVSMRVYEWFRARLAEEDAALGLTEEGHDA